MSVADNLTQIRARLDSATLIAVSKKQNTAVIKEAIEAGQFVFGENRVQEAQEKFSALRAVHPNLVLHLIGPLQTNKALAAVELFDVIQTVDRESLVDDLVKAVTKTGRQPRFYIQVNIGDEPQKSGVAVAETEGFLSYCRKHGLEINGLMCIPPQAEDPTPFFQVMRALADNLKLPHVSMGMSGDYETAIACGATEVRIGTSVFGTRS